MHPILFKIGNFAIYSYGVVIAFSVLWVSFLALRRGRKEGLDEEALLNIIFLVVISGLFGARLLHILVHFSYYLHHPAEIIAIRHGGMAAQGGLIFGLIAGIIFLRRAKLPTLRVLDLFGLYFPLAQAIGRIGCFLNGCCYGKETDFFWAVRFPFDGVARHPTQLYYALVNFAIFLILLTFHPPQFPHLLSSPLEGEEGKVRGHQRGKRGEGSLLLLYFLLYSASRYALDFFRGDLEPIFLSLYPTQVISFFIFLIAGGLFVFQLMRDDRHSHDIPG